MKTLKNIFVGAKIDSEVFFMQETENNNFKRITFSHQKHHLEHE